MNKKDTTSRRYQLTINNPKEKNITHDNIKNMLHDMKPLKYYCLCDEVGEAEHTPHTHVYIVFSTPVHFSTLKKAFPTAHIEPAKSTSQQNRDYILKQGKYETKSETSIEGTFEEYGTIPTERQGHRSDLDLLYEGIKDGASDIELIEANSSNMRYLNHIRQVREAINYEQVKDEFRKLYVTYIWGETGVGKTRSVMEKYGYSNVFRVTDYSHAFDQYRGQKILILDEYFCQFPLQALLQYLDGYPVELPARYANKWARYETVYIISNTSLDKQYMGVQEEHPATWYALLRRIHSVKEFLPNGRILEYEANDFANGFPTAKRDKLLKGEQVTLNDLLTEIYDENTPF